MVITLNLFATLSKYMPEDAGHFPIKDGETADALRVRLGVPEKDVHVIFINSRHATPDTVLKDGDRVGMFPAVGGG